jgi:hypothetical protein
MKHNFQIMFPSTLLGTGDKWTMMKTISATEYLNYEAVRDMVVTVLYKLFDPYSPFVLLMLVYLNWVPLVL